MRYILLIVVILFSMVVKGQNISTFAGNGSGSTHSGFLATSTGMYEPTGIAFDKYGNLFYTQQGGQVICKIDTNGNEKIIVGTGFTGFSGDGGLATAANINQPQFITLDTFGNVLFSDCVNHRIRKIDTSGIITTFAGNGTMGMGADSIPATASMLKYPIGICCDKKNNIYISDDSYRIRKINSAGIITTIAGAIGINSFSGDGGLAKDAIISSVGGLNFDKFGNLFLSDKFRIRKIDTLDIINTIAGDGDSIYNGDNITATSAQFWDVGPVLFDSLNCMYISDWINNRVRKIDLCGIIHTIAGNGNAGFSGDGGNADSAELNTPGGIGIDKHFNTYVADIYNYRIRKITYSTDRCSDSLLKIYPTKTNTQTSLYPNPTHNTLIIQTNEIINSIIITNMMGQAAYYSYELGVMSYELSVENWVSGVYFVNINNRVWSRFVKE